MTRYLALILLFVKTFISPAQKSSLQLIDSPGSVNILTAYYGYDTGGNTSVAFDKSDSFKWSGNSPYEKESFGYFDSDGNEIPYIKRDRDIGQTFRINATAPVRIKSLTLRLGFGDNVVRAGMYGQKLSVQFFEVTGTPKLNNNGSEGATKAFHGYPHDRSNNEIAAERDDFLSGERYDQIALFKNFTFPTTEDFGFNSDEVVPSGHDKLKGRFLKFVFSPGSSITLEPGKAYAFMVLIDKQGANKGFTLANNYSGSYPDGHAIRRDGSGTFPPVPADPSEQFLSPANKAAYKSAHFPENLKKRLSIQPSTNGYPDVDTWRDLYFILEGY